ncbi:MAG: glycoside hydrolase family 2 protein [Oscillospiraceae bacterium]|nr:glycoside hydrolase family 2 protein [Oscillospiraceae bacterium]
MTQHFDLNNGWEFAEAFTEAALTDPNAGDFVPVRLPHTCRETPYDYFDESVYQMDCLYRRTLTVPADWAGKCILLTFGAAGHCARVYLDGRLLAEHRCGYTAFTVDLTGHARPGQTHLLAVRVDSRETLDQPPFGFVIDYMTYGGLYREAWLEVKESAHIADVFARPRVDGTVDSDVFCAGVVDGCAIRQTVTLDGAAAAEKTAAADGADRTAVPVTLTVPDVRLWDIDKPTLYTLTTELLRGGEVLDRHTVRIGFREAKFTADGFYLNGRKVKLRGLNRHQSYPYVGYAMPASVQRMDADVLKKELGLNAVRTSHYPQSQHFIDRCDELGLLVFTEIPGWQHIGTSPAWRRQAVDNVTEMVTQYRNHPSVILWGVRINESKDDDELYTKTNETARKLDPTRPTGGVRCIKKSHLLEDVYTYNDFIHNGETKGCERKKDVTSDVKKPYLVSEYNGHMFPTKMFDSELHLLEHTLRHATVLDAVAGEEDIAGSFGWCMADYNTHQDFGSGDRICYHGVLDMYRNHKPAAAIYAVEQDETPVLEISSDMAIGEHPASNMGKIYILTNADSVRMYRNEVLLHEYTHKDSPFRHLRRGPILVTDFIGPRLEREEGMPPKQAKLVKDILNYSAVNGFAKLPPRILAKAGAAMARYRMTFQDAYDLYGKYIGNWGDTVATFRFEAVKDGAVVKTVEKNPVSRVVLDAKPDHTALREGAAYDVAAVRVTARDQNGNRLPFCNETVTLEADGPLEIIGPKLVQLRGGCGGTYVKTTCQSGAGALTLRCGQAEPIRISFEVQIEQ